MNPEIKKMLEDLYRLEPGLKAQEPALLKLIDELMASRPDTGFDEEFRERLRARLLREFPTAAQPAKFRLLDLFTGRNRLVFAVGGALLGVLLVALVVMPSKGPAKVSSQLASAPSEAIGLSGGPAVRPVAAHAFGSLSGAAKQESGISRQAAGATGSAEGAFAPAPSAVGDQSASSMSLGSSKMAVGLGGGGGAAAMMAEPGLMPAYRPTVYHFKYSGQLDLKDAQVAVLKRENTLNTKLLAGIIGRVDLGLMDLGKLQNLNVQSVSLVEDRDHGYWININFDDGSVTLSQNWPKWQQPAADCRPGLDCQPPRLRLEDMPSDDDVIRIADAFVKDMGISTADYGQPTADGSWRQYYETADSKADYWFPDQVTVIYPLLVQGKKVYNSDGRPAGMMVGVDVRSRRVANVSPLYSQNYASSDYEAETDAAKVAAVIAKGGIMPFYQGDGADAKVVEVELGAPEQAYYYSWSYANGLAENILVPALVFPIVNRPADQGLYLEQVVVPLAKELLEQDQNGGAILYMKGAVPPTPLPAETPAAAVETPPAQR